MESYLSLGLFYNWLDANKYHSLHRKALAQIPRLNERVEFLEQAIALNWSLSKIRQRISEKKSLASSPNTEYNDYKGALPMRLPN
ncbi:MAG TPA: hypothetical protein VE956_06025 [Nodularia sp. (in: cyanobacteria)]|nr:hypothetical protein [Nodularia sp. (in: cyanobacteria)]